MRIRHLSGCVAILALIWATRMLPDSEPSRAQMAPPAPTMSIKYQAGTARHWLKNEQVLVERTIMRAD